jgi:putative membrane protein
MMGMMCGMGGMFIGGLLLFALVVAGVVLLLNSRGGAGRGASSALQILDERLARGEIDQTDYQERRELLLREAGSLMR